MNTSEAYLDNNVRATEVMSYINSHPGCTRNEIVRGSENLTINTVSGRVAEMKRLDIVCEDGRKQDPFTKVSVGRLYIGKNVLGMGAAV